MIERKQVNPDMRTTAVELARRSNLHYMNLTDGVNMKEAWLMGLSIGIFIAALAGGFGAGWLIALALDKPGHSLPMSLVGAGILAVVVGLLELDWILSAGRPSYEAELGQDDRPTGRSFPQAADNPRRRVSLTEDDKRLIKAFALRYPAVRSMAINRFDGADSPFTFADNKKEAIKRVRRLLIRMGMARRLESGEVRLTEEGERKISDWQNNIFSSESDE